MLFAQGGITAGWSLYLDKTGALIFTHNFIDAARYRVTSIAPVPTGHFILAATFTYEGKPGEFGKGGTVVLTANGTEIGRGTIPRTVPLRYSLYEGQDVGEDDGSPVDDAYTAPFIFHGHLGDQGRSRSAALARAAGVQR